MHDDPEADSACVYDVQALDIMRFRERLELESETRQRMSSPELIQMCKERWAGYQAECYAFNFSKCFALSPEASSGMAHISSAQNMMVGC